MCFCVAYGLDFAPAVSGKYDNSILCVANKDYPAAAIANLVLNRKTLRWRRWSA